MDDENADSVPTDGQRTEAIRSWLVELTEPLERLCAVLDLSGFEKLLADTELRSAVVNLLRVFVQKYNPDGSSTEDDLGLTIDCLVDIKHDVPAEEEDGQSDSKDSGSDAEDRKKNLVKARRQRVRKTSTQPHDGKEVQCDFCHKRFNTRSHLVRHRRIHTGEKPYTCDSCQKSFSDQSSLRTHRMLHSNERPFRCAHCGMGFRSKFLMERHAFNKHVKRSERADGESRGRFCCERCDFSSYEKYELKRHLRARHNESLDSTEEESRKRKEGTRGDGESGYAAFPELMYSGTAGEDLVDFPSSQESKPVKVSRMRTVKQHQKTAQCEECGKIMFPSNLKRHLEAHGVREKSFKCDQCDFGCSDSYELKRHKSVRHEKRLPYVCDQCGKAFAVASRLNVHKRCVHSWQKLFECPMCGSRFSLRSYVLKHMRKVHQKIRSPEEAKYDLKRHIKHKHERRKGYTCDQCGKSVTYSKSLKQHMLLVHSDIREFPCPVCGRHFALKDAMMVHLRSVHEKIRAEVCALCGKDFKRTTHLKYHVEHVHNVNKPSRKRRRKTEDGASKRETSKDSEEKKSTARRRAGSRGLQCEICGKTFCTEQVLRAHGVVHTGEKPYACAQCGRTFTRYSSMYKHKKLVHENDSSARKRHMCNICEVKTEDTTDDFPDEESDHRLQEAIQQWLLSLLNPLAKLVEKLDDVIALEFFQGTFLSEVVLNVVEEVVTQYGFRNQDDVFGLRRSSRNIRLRIEAEDVMEDLIPELEEGQVVLEDLCEETFELREEDRGVRKSQRNKSQKSVADEKREEWSHPERKKSTRRRRKVKDDGMEAVEGTQSSEKKAHPKRPSQCEICGKEFSSIQLYRVHRVVHTGDKPFQCTVCSKRFSHKASLFQHKKLHSGERPHQCHQCEARFNQKQHLQRHLVSHDPEKGHRCDICGKTFIAGHVLKRHKMSHTGEKRFQCTTCDKGFIHSTNFQRHMAMHRGEKPHQCDICGYRCTQKGDLKRHRGRHLLRDGERTTRMEPHQLPSKKKLNNLDGSGNPEIKMKRPRGRPSKNTLKDVEENSENDQGSGCRNERKKLKSTLGRLQCEICGKGFGTKQRLKYHSVIHTGEKPYECPVCFKKFAFLSAMLGHRKSVHTNEKPHECKTCGARFIRRQQLLRHQMIRHWLDSSLAVRLDKLLEGMDDTAVLELFEDGFLCQVVVDIIRELLPQLKMEGVEETDGGDDPTCIEVDDWIDDVEIQTASSKKKRKRIEALIEEKGDEIWKAKGLALSNRRVKAKMEEPCEVKEDVDELLLEGSVEGDLGDEGEVVKPDSPKAKPRLQKFKPRPKRSGSESEEGGPRNKGGPAQCEVCGKTFSTRQWMISHTRIHTGEKPFQCSFCAATFAHAHNLRLHLRTHTGERPYPCDVCGKRFLRKQLLQRHQISHNPESAPTCDICGRTFTESHGLKLHKRSMHSHEKPFLCEICNKTFSRSHHLKRHLQMHRGEKPHQCDLCGYRCTQKGDLKRHRERHGKGEKIGRHACDVCGKTFTAEWSVKIHKRLHTGDKPFLCDLCNKSFSRSHHLHRHLAMHRGEKPHQCEVCGFCCTQKGDLKRHRERHHGGRSAPSPTTWRTLVTKAWRRILEDVLEVFPPPPLSQGVKEACSSDERQEVSTGPEPKRPRGRPRKAQQNKHKFSCPTCGKGFPYQSQLRIHTQVHSLTKEFQCEYCGQEFRIQGTIPVRILRPRISDPRHLLKSSEEYWLDVLIPAIKEMLLKLEQVSAVAEDCLKNGGETGDLTDALGNSKIEGTKSGDVLGEKSVTNTKPRAKGSCQKCGEVATPEHTCAKSFECTDCGVEFPSRSRLTAHFLRVHPLTSVESSEERGKGQSYLRSCGNRGVGANKTPHACEKRLRFKCETCGKLFPYRYRLNLHQVRAHPSQVSEELSSKGRTRYCRSCGKTVNTTAHVCERAHKCQVCERQFPYRYLLNRHLQTHSSIKDIQCEFCGKGFRTQTNYQEHRKIHLGLKPEQCHEDLLRELDVSGAWREMVRKLLDGLFGELESIFGEGSVMLTGGRRMERGFLEPKVEIMENTFPSFDDTVELPDPYATASTKTLDDKGACSNPGAPDEWKSAEDSQKASPSSGSTPKQYCKQCGKKVRVGASHTCEKPFKCEICGMSFPYRYRLSLHLRTHPTANVSCVPRKYSRGGSEKTCGQCGKAVAENEWHDCEDQSTSASGSADGEARQHCKDCGKKVSVSASHTCEKPFKCEVCGMCFPYRYRLNLHLRTHPNATVTCEPRKYSSSSKKGPLQYCKGCGKKVSINTPHACEKPFKCEVCGLGFPYQFRLNLHLRTHSSAKEFQCEYCGKSFRLPGSWWPWFFPSAVTIMKDRLRAELMETLLTVLSSQAQRKMAELEDDVVVKLAETRGLWNELVARILTDLFDEVNSLLSKRLKMVSDENLIDGCDSFSDSVVSNSEETKMLELEGDVDAMKEVSNGSADDLDQGESCATEDGDERSQRRRKRAETSPQEKKSKVTCRKCGKRTHCRKIAHVCEKLHTCDMCHKTFAYSYLLRIHRPRCSQRPPDAKANVEPLSCRKCGKKLPRGPEHVCERRYVCPTCGKAFPYEHQLKIHSRVHSLNKEFQCEFCGKELRSQSALIEHRKIHFNNRVSQQPPTAAMEDALLLVAQMESQQQQQQGHLQPVLQGTFDSRLMIDALGVEAEMELLTKWDTMEREAEASVVNMEDDMYLRGLMDNFPRPPRKKAAREAFQNLQRLQLIVLQLIVLQGFPSVQFQNLQRLQFSS
ncbi:unnamed protein product [Cyprideis torosa]|uniref:Zinc finger protein 865 n=1 Tax=Cyprideis torosa TaxID=163714 RepID=A0A7R8WBV9_9CRUS|nr:unnamed protein product [Cyprideis torosa]CAG0891315.1 unnamed protein product [Cyprideis torosa]